MRTRAEALAGRLGVLSKRELDERGEQEALLLLEELDEAIARVEEQIRDLEVERVAAARVRGGDADETSDARQTFADLGIAVDE